MQKELDYLDGAIANPERPFTAILGGAKISGKIDVIDSLMDKVDTLIIGGGMAYTFIKAMGYEIGSSLLEEEKIDLAKEMLKMFETTTVKVLLPLRVDNVNVVSSNLIERLRLMFISLREILGAGLISRCP